MPVIEVKVWKGSVLQITYILKKEKSLCNCWGGIFQVDCNSQYLRMAEVGRSLETTEFFPLLRQGCLEKFARSCAQLCFEYFQR